jgi:predicted PurR-regulated permease PerM
VCLVAAPGIGRVVETAVTDLDAGVPAGPADAAPPTPGPVTVSWPGPAYWAKAAVVVLVVIGLALLVVDVVDVLILVLVSMVFGIGMQRPVQWLERRHVPRSAAVALILGAVVAVVGGFLALILPAAVHEVSSLVSHGPEYIDKFRNEGWVRSLDQRFDLTTRLEKLGRKLPDQAWNIGTSLISATVDTLTIVVLTSYFAVDFPRLRETVATLLKPSQRDHFDAIADRVTQRVGGYVSGNFIVSIVAGVTSFVAFLVVGVPYAAALAVWVALTDLIPTVGALLGAAAGIVVAGVSGGVRDLVIVGVFFLVYQQVENYLIVPKVMKGAINMSIGAVLISVLVGGQLGGFMGVLLALPLAAALQTALDELYLRERRRSVRLLQLREERVRRWMARLGRRSRPGAEAPGGPAANQAQEVAG